LNINFDLGARGDRAALLFVRRHIMNLPHRRQFLHLTAGVTALPAVSRVAWAQAYPTRPVRIIVGAPPGGPQDILARLVAQWLSERLGQPFLVENRPGAGGNIGAEAVVRALPDGYTLLLAGSLNAINVTLYDKLNFNFARDITPVASIMRVPNVIEVNPSVPAKTVPEFISYAKANPGKINMGSGGNGTPAHVSGELFKAMTGIDLVHVRYRGLRSTADRSNRRSSADCVRAPVRVHRVYQGGQVACAGRHDGQ
jgi:tripartite-type tricarboxylate transporter receptor subunit TctC